ncbi:hypothetical protein AMAG_08503 [Allomyces macrogynus ATCC 38327]|uniref:Tudor domain-containing protein n=1 Tax=Allomyces macrogynus (strain ATCC 38327) TaxID=578462 RepID=A0A0L0SLU9_ALLM3|nr:hypothetical protein AMAG_08503 [Allomyces macrogynus ATCC 38327]|eukprot:KNE63365.1 hypothetical protein AMAG_08503 [Allomyces macrogynus ATCC 38327]
MAEELDNYYFQLEQVKLALDADPHNADLRQLLVDLEEVIALTQSLTGASVPAPAAAPVQTEEATPAPDDDVYNAAFSEIEPVWPPSAPTTSSPSPAPPSSIGPVWPSAPAAAPSPSPAPAPAPSGNLVPKYRVGDQVAAKWAVNGKIYEATISAVSTQAAKSADDIVYSVVFAGYTSVELVRQADVQAYDPAIIHKPTSKKRAAPSSSSTSSAQPVISSVANNDDSAKKRKKDPTVKAAKRAAKLEAVNAEHTKAQQSWLQFASGKKKGNAVSSTFKPVPILAKKSMFATPDNPHAKVGVTGSGRGMTDFSERGKHKFEPQFDQYGHYGSR